MIDVVISSQHAILLRTIHMVLFLERRQLNRWAFAMLQFSYERPSVWYNWSSLERINQMVRLSCDWSICRIVLRVFYISQTSDTSIHTFFHPIWEDLFSFHCKGPHAHRVDVSFIFGYSRWEAFFNLAFIEVACKYLLHEAIAIEILLIAEIL